jgi:excisionase family DNA binding protein
MTQPKESTLPDVKWLTVPEVAAYIRCSRVSVYRWIKEGSLPAVKFGPDAGRNFRIAESAVADFMRETVKPE